jgi:hypothetical protein
MTISRALLALPVALLLAGCPGEERQVDEPFVTEAPQPGTPGTDPGMTAVPGAMQGQTAQMQPIGDSNVRGEITVTDRGETQTEVMVRLTGAPAGTRHPGHVHSGTCDSIGGVVQPLEPIETDAAGTGTMTATLDLPPMQLMDGQHVVVYHGAGGAPVTCGQIGQHMM